MFRRILNRISRIAGHSHANGDSMHEATYRLVVEAIFQMAKQNTNQTVDGIVFSMDRALQLHALLGSYRDNVVGGPKLTIIYRATNEAHEKAYKQALSDFDDVIEIAILQETPELFHDLVINRLKTSKAKTIFFLVDDNLFIEPVNLQTFAAYATPFSIPSLRLGENLGKSYTQNKNQPLPVFYPHSFSTQDLLAWHWGNGLLDWAYPLSADGHLLSRLELLAIAEVVDFSSPNTFESNLQRFNFAFLWRSGICFRKSRLVNIPYNRVQTDFDNLHGSIHQDEMLSLWNDGCRIDRKAYYGLKNESAHQEFPLRLFKSK